MDGKVRHFLSTRGRLIGGALIGGGLAVAVVVAIVLATRPHGTHASSPTAFGQERQLAGQIHASLHLSMHATYRALGDPAKLGGSITYEVWQRPPQVREEATLVSGAGTTSRVARVARFVSGAGPATRCSQTASMWTCDGSGTSVAPGPLELLTNVSGQLAGRPVTASDQAIGNRKVRCYQAGPLSDTFVLCAAANGTPVLVANRDVRYQLVTVSPSVDSKAFTLPA